MTAKEQYRLFCESAGPQVPLFQQYWWMETVCRGKQWDVALAFDGDWLSGAMPYHYGKKRGVSFVLQPQLTQYSGPLYLYPDGLSESRRLEFETTVARQLLAQVEARKPAVFLQSFAPGVTNWLPYYWAGFRQTTRYTYRIEDISDPDRLLEQFDRQKRQRKIHRFAHSTTTRFDMEPADFARFHRQYWLQRGQKDLLDSDFVEHVCREAIGRGQGVIASLHDGDGNLLAARFAAYDSRCAYSLMSALDVDRHRSGHSECLFWTLMQHLADKSCAFDFEGSMDEGIEYFYRSFGAVQTPYFQISKYRNLLFELLIRKKNRSLGWHANALAIGGFPVVY